VFITKLDDSGSPPSVQFSAASQTVGEGAGKATVTITRSGDASIPVKVAYATSDGTASERSDYTAAVGSVTFLPQEMGKSFDLLITDDNFVEGNETVNISLLNAEGATLGSPTTLALTISDNDSGTSGPNPVDDSAFFVREHYHDFLNREPDADGIAFWTQEIESCGSNQQCREAKRINVSAAFFLSIEFQETGYLVYRTYKAAFGDATSLNVPGTVPVVRLREFLSDAQSIGHGVVVNQGDWQAQLESNKSAFALAFVQRARFLSVYPITMTPTQFVDKLNQNAGGVLGQDLRDQLISRLSSSTDATAGRALVLRQVAENPTLRQMELNRAFVLMQYYGYLRRNPDDPQDTDFRGWKFWLDKLNQFNGNFVQAEMVRAFISSDEYRKRFGQ
jgi:hypothetical protein